MADTGAEPVVLGDRGGGAGTSGQRKEPPGGRAAIGRLEPGLTARTVVGNRLLMSVD